MHVLKKNKEHMFYRRIIYRNYSKKISLLYVFGEYRKIYLKKLQGKIPVEEMNAKISERICAVKRYKFSNIMTPCWKQQRDRKEMIEAGKEYDDIANI